MQHFSSLAYRVCARPLQKAKTVWNGWKLRCLWLVIKENFIQTKSLRNFVFVGQMNWLSRRQYGELDEVAIAFLLKKRGATHLKKVLRFILLFLKRHSCLTDIDTLQAKVPYSDYHIWLKFVADMYLVRTDDAIHKLTDVIHNKDIF